MIQSVYQTLSALGYHHPLHPIMVHLPIGLIMAGFLFSLVAIWKENPSFSQTARHCMMLALISLVPTVMLGLMDWHYFYRGAFIFPIKIKFILAAVLIVLLAAVVYRDMKSPSNSKTLIGYGICLITIVGLGYFGGELVFGQRPPNSQSYAKNSENDLISKGAMIFRQNCAGCHYTDRNDFKMGPGLKDLFQQKALYKSNWPVNEETVRKQITDPFGTMPSYADLSNESLDELMAYLKTL